MSLKVCVVHLWFLDWLIMFFPSSKVCETEANLVKMELLSLMVAIIHIQLKHLTLLLVFIIEGNVTISSHFRWLVTAVTVTWIIQVEHHKREQESSRVSTFTGHEWKQCKSELLMLDSTFYPFVCGSVAWSCDEQSPLIASIVHFHP